MPRIVVTHAIEDTDRWLRGKAERRAAAPGTRDVTDLVALDGSLQAAVLFEVDDVEAFTSMLATMPPDVAAQAESHGVVPPFTVYVQPEPTMDHTATMRRTYELINDGDIDGFGDLLADDFVEHQEAPGLPPTKAGVLDLFRGYRAAFPDLRMDAVEVLATGDRTVARVTASGTQTGDFMGIPASGRQAQVELIDIMRFDDAGLACEHWGVVDMLSLLHQLGAIPEAAEVP